MLRFGTVLGAADPRSWARGARAGGQAVAAFEQRAAAFPSCAGSADRRLETIPHRAAHGPRAERMGRRARFRPTRPHGERIWRNGAVLDESSVSLTFDDVLLVPRPSDVLPGETDVTSRVTREISVKIPILSPAMEP